MPCFTGTVTSHNVIIAVEDGPVVYDKISREAIMTRVRDNGLHLWQQKWTNTGKGAVTKAFFPAVRHKLRQKIPVNPQFTSMVTGHGKLRSYLYRFRLTDNPTCPCEEAEDQTTNRLIFRCKELHNKRTEFIKELKYN